jgi:hypothetical protein
MPKGKLLWRARKVSEANPILAKDCGCKYYVRDGTVVRPCPAHDPMKKQEEAPDA